MKILKYFNITLSPPRSVCRSSEARCEIESFRMGASNLKREESQIAPSFFPFFLVNFASPHTRHASTVDERTRAPGTHGITRYVNSREAPRNTKGSRWTG